MKQIVSEDIHQIISDSEVEFKNQHSIDTHNWGDYPNINANFCIANDSSNIYLRYLVTESNVMGTYMDIHDPVYKDSCVEFFISFDEEYYYNFEFNCIGNVLAAYGRDRNNRELLPKEKLKSLEIESSLGRNRIQIENREIDWQLDIKLPIGIFLHSGIDSLTGKVIRCNFYKCGDDLPNPHYLSWNPVNSDIPNFHLSEFFGELKLN